MALLSKQPIVKAGLNPATTAAAGGGDSFANSGNEFLRVANGGVAPINVTIAAQAGACTTYGVTNAAHNNVVAVPNGEERWIGPVDPRAYNDANGLAQVTYSGVTDVTVGVYSMGRG